MIIENRVKLIFKNGNSQQYSHVEWFETRDENLIIKGEREGEPAQCENSYTDNYDIKNILDMSVEFYISKV